jgi:hypothetical protein
MHFTQKTQLQEFLKKILHGNLWIYPMRGPLWSYGTLIYNYLCNQCPPPLMFWVRILIRARCTTLCDKVCQWLVTGQWFSPAPPVSSTNKSDRHDITEILLKVALNTIKQTSNKYLIQHYVIKFVSDLRLVIKFVSDLRLVSGFLHQ